MDTVLQIQSQLWRLYRDTIVNQKRVAKDVPVLSVGTQIEVLSLRMVNSDGPELQ